MDQNYRRDRYNPSFFFPVALITVGVVWLLVNNGVIPTENIYRLMPFWPVLLILAGLSVLFRRIWWPINLLIWGGAAVLLVAALIAPPTFLPRVSPIELKHLTLNEAVGQATSADVELHLSINPVTVHALQNSKDLVNADIYASNDVTLDVSGTTQKNITLRERFGPDFAWWRFDQYFQPNNRKWDIGLSGDVPMKLLLDASTGSANVDLTGVQLTGMTINASTGSMTVKLPEGQNLSPINVDASTGSMVLDLPANTSEDLNINASTGGITIHIPQGAGVQITVTSEGTGGLHLPAEFTKTQGAQNRKEGVYVTPAFSGAKNPIKISLDMSTGGVTIE